MFSYRLGGTSTQLRVLLATDHGYLHGPDDPWGLLPVEAFRIDSILHLVFSGGVPAEIKDGFCEQVLGRLNASKWRKWDEIKDSYHLPDGHQFVALAVYLVEVDFVVADPDDRSDVVRAQCLHCFDPGQVFQTITGIPGRYAGGDERGIPPVVD
jgi:hypothetical protein